MKVTNMIDREKRIAIIGAGPAGLSTAWFLANNGYHNVTVLEKLGRVGGLCKSITIRGSSFDLGANYVTWGYTETLRIAKEVGATTTPEVSYTSLKIYEEDGQTKVEQRPMVDAVLKTLTRAQRSHAGRSSSPRCATCSDATS